MVVSLIPITERLLADSSSELSRGSDVRFSNFPSQADELKTTRLRRSGVCRSQQDLAESRLAAFDCVIRQTSRRSIVDHAVGETCFADVWMADAIFRQARSHFGGPNMRGWPSSGIQSNKRRAALCD